MKHILKLIRPHQWVKNIFVLLPLFFGGALTNTQALINGILAAIAYSFFASSIYCFNDIYDVEADRRHPAKCTRPIASGKVTITMAYCLMAVMLLLGMAVCLLIKGNNEETLLVLCFYYIMNICYCIKLKHYAIIDVCIVAMGFVIRIIAGGVAANVALSEWIVLMTFLLTLFLSFAKRRDDVVRMNETGQAPRKNTIRYNLTFINQAITITSSISIVCYVLYTVSPEVEQRFNTKHLYLTTIFVLIGFLRYIQLSVVDKKSGDPTKVLLKDRFTQVVVLAWLVAFASIIYIV